MESSALKNLDQYKDDRDQNTRLDELLLSSAKLETTIVSADGTCSCICISDCACNPSCYTQ